jgi:hypothetical protein
MHQLTITASSDRDTPIFNTRRAVRSLIWWLEPSGACHSDSATSHKEEDAHASDPDLTV